MLRTEKGVQLHLDNGQTLNITVDRIAAGEQASQVPFNISMLARFGNPGAVSFHACTSVCLSAAEIDDLMRALAEVKLMHFKPLVVAGR